MATASIIGPNRNRASIAVDLLSSSLSSFFELLSCLGSRTGRQRAQRNITAATIVWMIPATSGKFHGKIARAAFPQVHKPICAVSTGGGMTTSGSADTRCGENDNAIR